MVIDHKHIYIYIYIYLFWNIVCKTTVTNVAMMQNFEVFSDIHSFRERERERGGVLEICAVGTWTLWLLTCQCNFEFRAVLPTGWCDMWMWQCFLYCSNFLEPGVCVKVFFCFNLLTGWIAIMYWALRPHLVGSRCQEMDVSWESMDCKHTLKWRVSLSRFHRRTVKLTDILVLLV